MSEVEVVDDFKIIITDANNLIEAFHQAKKGCTWKASIQSYEINLFKNIRKTQKKILDNDYSQLPFNCFILCDKGKVRYIKAVNIIDRVVLRCLCDKILIPKIQKYYIYDNGASVKGKGIHFTRQRLLKHLREFWNIYKDDGYILLIDFSKFFDNIPHDKLLERFNDILQDKETMKYLKEAIISFKVDTYKMNENERSNCYSQIFNSVEYAKRNVSYIQKKQQFMYKSLGIGSQVSQIAGLLYPTYTIDNYCKIVKGLKWYGRYMDDVYILHPDKEYLQKLLKELKIKCAKDNLFINDRKTQIIKLTKGFSFLKMQYFFTNTGKIIQKPNKKAITRQRRKLKSMKKMLDNNKKNFSFKQISISFESWKGTIKYFNSYNQIQNMTKLYNSLFKDYL